LVNASDNGGGAVKDEADTGFTESNNEQLFLRVLSLLNRVSFLLDTVVQGPIAVPHLVPLLMAMEGEDPVENSERGCQLLYDVLQAARNAALHAPDYQQHAHALLTGRHRAPQTSHSCEHGM